ncbi:cdc42 effector protein 2 [Platysternon megacephalum]|uniref:Cdc42 effector protein 2 n=1 Tax=Platysternon megacephalum TaxID=55544 RepID=A0A4D9EQ61_9SAUR|nr:cdc42 effector protein 2 [Platysternon megacephalum]
MTGRRSLGSIGGHAAALLWPRGGTRQPPAHGKPQGEPGLLSAPTRVGRGQHGSPQSTAQPWGNRQHRPPLADRSKDVARGPEPPTLPPDPGRCRFRAGLCS